MRHGRPFGLFVNPLERSNNMIEFRSAGWDARSAIVEALAVAVLLDATVVRLVLGPALLQVAGRWNWWPRTRA